jgi:hypothetical protein
VKKVLLRSSSDAIAAFKITDHNGDYHSADEIQKVELATLYQEFATIVSTKELLNKIK